MARSDDATLVPQFAVKRDYSTLHRAKTATGFVQWEIFHTQELALAYMAEHDAARPPLRLFSFEFDAAAPGRRRFLVSTLTDFWNAYQDFRAADRADRGWHYYEVVCPDLPARLYFDVEFDIALNRPLVAHADHVVRVLKRGFCRELLHTFGYVVQPDDFVDLDSTSATKFSRHLILSPRTRRPDADERLFPSNLAMGHFVQPVCDKILAHAFETDECLQPDCAWCHGDDDNSDAVALPPNTRPCDLLVANSHAAGLALVIDRGVYTRYRNFRMCGSSKIGKTVRLTWKAPARACLAAAAEGYPRPMAASAPRARGSHAASSPWPGVDAWVLQMARRDAPPEHPNPERIAVSRIKLVSDRVASYTIAGDRYCMLIGRQHRSNGVYYVVNMDLRRATRRCFDHECTQPQRTHLLPPELVVDALPA
ncbi:hypothetical protein CXG81DRAFT_26022 [Caulochytrium protostelioides]|uniref:DNA-directed primase/polymerase protein n=1 Tax=Caulochytrium protostelioides TaxID=1555241 RepID=A0A4P9X7U6_9FUNG|nr:hypothetical protein CXG81DRAFT_26022 [Caulochytrium protostelioides]|eukprot:RKP01308.1 hypothetical protein CXG81DRAFT_26022 [Caulochytrium protostelioides]